MGENMKSITEFNSHKLAKGLHAKTALAAEGKTADEIQQSLGEAFKLEGEKLKFFFNALDVASQNIDKLARVLVVKLNEGESIPPKAVLIEEHHYLPDFLVDTPAPTHGSNVKSGGQNKNKKSGPKSSPWGMSPEEKAAKVAARKASDAAKNKPS